MQIKRLGHSQLQVSDVCLGTMMMGSQTPTELSKLLLSEAFELGINFLDTAELYSVPPRPKTQGNSERVIGEWLQETGKRDQIIIATKVVGRCEMNWIRGYPAESKTQLCLDEANITHAVENSLKRLQTDYIDLYQIHWPDRRLPIFGGNVAESPLDSLDFIPIKETLTVLSKLVEQGKVRYVGISNENLNGTREYIRLAEEAGLPAITSIQNAYSLVNREFEGELEEFCMANKVSLLPYSILAMGYLTGKYLNGENPADSRKALFGNVGRYAALDDDQIVNQYLAIAEKFDLTLNQLAHAFVYQQPFIDSTIIGATSVEQLVANVGALDVKLTADINQLIDEVHRQQPDPCK